MTTESRNPASHAGQQSDVAEELKHDADRLKGTVGARAKDEVESRKGQAAHVAGSASTALNTAADDLRDNPDVPDWMASALQQAARKIESLASHIDGRSVDQLGHDIAEFARRNPGTFLAASAAAGFAASRVMRAGMDKKRHASDGAQGAQDYSGGAQDWPADENVKPTGTGSGTGGFAPAYDDPEQGVGGYQPGLGGTTR